MIGQRMAGAVALALALLQGCDGTDTTDPAVRVEPAAGGAGKRLDPAVCAAGSPGFAINSSNPYFPIPVGRRWTYTGVEDGETLELQITVLDLVRVIQGITTRVVEERETVDGELLEVSWNYYGQASDGTICYFGEDVDIHEDEEISHEGAWCADEPGHRPGIVMPADPRPGMRFRMEIAPGIAEDQARIVGSGPIRVPYGRFPETIRFREFNPIDGDKGYKVFAANVGLVVDGPAELVGLRQTSGRPEEPMPTEQECGTP